MSTYTRLQEKLDGRQYSNYFAACCPFHDDHSPSFFVYEDGKWFCKSNSCHARGNTLEQLEKRLTGRNVKITPSKPQVLPRWKLWEEKYGDLTGIAKYAHQSVKRYPQFMWYLKSRQIDRFFDDGFFGVIDNWVLFPVFNESKKIVSIVLRYTGKNRDTTRYVTHQSIDGKQYLYIPNRDRVNNSDYVVLCYGIVDAWSFEDVGIPAVTGCTGKFSSADLLSPLHKKVYIVPDLGEERDAHRLANSLGWRGKVVNLPFPDDCKDADEIRVKHGKDVLLSMVEDKIREKHNSV